MNRNFSTQFKKFCFSSCWLCFFLVQLTWYHFPSFSSCSSSNCSGTRHSAFQDRLISSASLPNFLLRRCFSGRPNFVSTEFDASGLKFASLIPHASNAAWFKSKMSLWYDIDFTESLIGSPYLLGPFFDLPLLRTDVSSTSDLSENPGGFLDSSSSPAFSLECSISAALRCTPLSSTWSANRFQSAAVKSLLLNVSRMVSGDVLRDISFFLLFVLLWGVEVDFGTPVEFDEHAWGCCYSNAVAAHLFLRLVCFESFAPVPSFILDVLVNGPAM